MGVGSDGVEWAHEWRVELDEQGWRWVTYREILWKTFHVGGMKGLKMLNNIEMTKKTNACHSL